MHKLDSLLFILALSFATSSCIGTKNNNSPVSQPELVWSLTDRHAHIQSEVEVTFKSGNRRRGRLLESKNQNEIDLDHGNERVTYQMREIVRIQDTMLPRRTIFPKE